LLTTGIRGDHMPLVPDFEWAGVKSYAARGFGHIASMRQIPPRAKKSVALPIAPILKADGPNLTFAAQTDWRDPGLRSCSLSEPPSGRALR
jgi:hypothetical protein